MQSTSQSRSACLTDSSTRAGTGAQRQGVKGQEPSRARAILAGMAGGLAHNGSFEDELLGSIALCAMTILQFCLFCSACHFPVNTFFRGVWCFVPVCVSKSARQGSGSAILRLNTFWVHGIRAYGL